jgi:hypothetical protein
LIRAQCGSGANLEEILSNAAGLFGSLKTENNQSAELRREGSMPDFKLLAEATKPGDPERCILIEVIHEPAIGKHYSVTGKGLDLAHQSSGDFTDGSLEEARERALELAKAVNIPII